MFVYFKQFVYHNQLFVYLHYFYLQIEDDPTEWTDFNLYEDLFSSPTQPKKKKKEVKDVCLPLELTKCSYCDAEVDRKRMEQHMYTKHKDVKLHICDQCPFKTNSLINLTRHIDNMHLAIKYEF